MTFRTLAKPMFRAIALLSALVLGACAPQVGARGDGVFAPGVNRLATAEDGVNVGHRLISAGEYELALRAFTRAALDRGETDGEILLGMGTANLGLGRLHQAEKLLRLAAEREQDWPEVYNNLGVVLMEQGREREAAAVFHRAFALDNGNTDEIRNNLKAALAKKEAGALVVEDNAFKLVRRGAGDYLIAKTP